MPARLLKCVVGMSIDVSGLCCFFPDFISYRLEFILFRPDVRVSDTLSGTECGERFSADIFGVADGLE